MAGTFPGWYWWGYLSGTAAPAPQNDDESLPYLLARRVITHLTSMTSSQGNSIWREVADTGVATGGGSPLKAVYSIVRSFGDPDIPGTKGDACISAQIVASSSGAPGTPATLLRLNSLIDFEETKNSSDNLKGRGGCTSGSVTINNTPNGDLYYWMQANEYGFLVVVSQSHEPNTQANIFGVCDSARTHIPIAHRGRAFVIENHPGGTNVEVKIDRDLTNPTGSNGGVVIGAPVQIVGIRENSALTMSMAADSDNPHIYTTFGTITAISTSSITLASCSSFASGSIIGHQPIANWMICNGAGNAITLGHHPLYKTAVANPSNQLCDIVSGGPDITLDEQDNPGYGQNLFAGHNPAILGTNVGLLAKGFFGHLPIGGLFSYKRGTNGFGEHIPDMNDKDVIKDFQTNRQWIIFPEDANTQVSPAAYFSCWALCCSGSGVL